MTHPPVLGSINSCFWYKKKGRGSRGFHKNLCRQLKDDGMEIKMEKEAGD